MQFRRLGRTGLKVSVIGFGGIPIQRIGFDETKAVIDACFENGINFFDTARVYSDSEEKLGYALKGRRDFIISTKSTAKSRGDMARDVDTSLNNLKLDKIDLYNIHFVRDKNSLNRIMGKGGALEAVKEAMENGKIDHLGVTTHMPDVAEKAIETNEFETLMVPFNYMEMEMESVIEMANDVDMGTIIMKPLAGGSIRNAAASLKFIKDYNVSTIIPGMDSVGQVEENTRAESSKITKGEIKKLEEEKKQLGKDFCHRCEYCMPCPNGLDIPILLLYEVYYSKYNLRKWASERYAEQSHRASDCKECGVCEARCPYNLPIREKLKKVAEVFGE
jgi:predicted aldo/keto reductase-like oxidoreductase